MEDYKKMYEKLAEMNDSEFENEGLEMIQNAIDSEIIRIAFDSWVDGYCDGVCVLLPDGTLEGRSYSGNSYDTDEFFELYRLKSDWVHQNSWDHHTMIVSNEELEKLKEMFGDDADWTDEKQLAEIGVDYKERLLEYLIWVD